MVDGRNLAHLRNSPLVRSPVLSTLLAPVIHLSYPEVIWK